MKGRYTKRFYLFAIIVLIAHTTFAQQLEFVENKGQWDKNISFKGEMTFGAFALKPDGGYRLLLYNKSDLQQVHNYFHGEPYTSNVTGASSTQQKGTYNTNAVTQPVAGKGAASTGNPDLVLHAHIYEVKFLNSNPHPLAIPDKPLDTYNNYLIGNDSSKWAGHCRVFYAVTYKDIYPNIDVHYYTDNGNLKYDFIVHPGGDVNRIAMYIDGANNIQVKDGQLVIKTSVDEVREAIPHSYQVASVGRKEVSCSYKLKGNIVRFNINDEISTQSTLVIDPQLVFSTFSGSTVDNWGFTATYDGLGNLYAGGIVFGSGFLVSNGAYQTFYKGGSSTGEYADFDIGIIKYDPLGQHRLYATYLGGAGGNEYPHSLVTDSLNELIIAGKTTSNDYPVLPARNPAIDGPGDNFDIIVTKLSVDGSKLIGSRRIGGTGDDGVNIKNKYPIPASNPLYDGAVSIRRNYGDDSRSEVIVDKAGNIYLASCSQSNNFPVTANAFQKTIGSVSPSAAAVTQDAVILKFPPDLSTITFSSFLGGTGDDAAFVLAINPLDNNIYIAGGTTSTDFPGDKTGVMFPSFQGGVCDGFVSIVSNDGTQLIKTGYFGGQLSGGAGGGNDIIYGIQFDKHGYPYIMGTTTADWPTTNNVNYKDAGGKQFISKLQPDLSAFVYSTVFGTNSQFPNISPTAFLVDRCENVYVSGWGGDGDSRPGYYTSSGTLGLKTTLSNTPPGAILKSSTDGSDFYFFVLERNAQSMLFSCFYGQVDNAQTYPDHVDGGTSRFDANGAIYQSVCANCGDHTNFPTSNGSWSPNNGAAASGGCNLASVKINFNLAGIGAALKSSILGTPGRNQGCVPLTVDFRDTIGAGKSYVWDFGDGTPKQTTTVNTIEHVYTAVGTYNVMLVSIDSGSCNIADTAYETIRVRNDEATLAMNAVKLPPCDALNYQFTNTSTAPAGKPFTNTSFTLNFGDGQSQVIGGASVVTHAYAAAGTYKAYLVLTDTNYCNAPDSILITLRIATNVKAVITTPLLGCAPYTANIINNSSGGSTFTWDFGDGTTSTDADPAPHAYPNTGTYTIKLVASDPSTCNKIDSTTVTITVVDKPTAAFSYSPVPPKENTPFDFTNASIGGTHYKWIFGDGTVLETVSEDTVVSHLYNVGQTYNVCLVAYNDNGCSDTTCQSVTPIVVPLVDVPNAFTPNGDGRNDYIYVRGFGITKMVWRIYNRWGAVVFQTGNLQQGWDGRYNGVLQPQDVYTYTLNVEFSDGTQYNKKGDITLLR